MNSDFGAFLLPWTMEMMAVTRPPGRSGRAEPRARMWGEGRHARPSWQRGSGASRRPAGMLAAGPLERLGLPDPCVPGCLA